MSSTAIKVLMASAEVAPLAKAGGLGDVVPSLSAALQKNGVEVVVVMPKYGFIGEEGLKRVKEGVTVSGGKEERVDIWETFLDSGVKVYLVGNDGYFGKDKIYWGNNAERFLFFSRAVISILPEIMFKPDIIHCHDFHTALIPALLTAEKEECSRSASAVYTIHNLNYQGKADPKLLSVGGLPPEELDSLARDAEDGDINFMVQGIIHADAVTTVSSTYAEEITSSPQGAGLEKVITENSYKLHGIVNGIDMTGYDPATDQEIYHNYSADTVESKEENKLKLQKEVGLPANKDRAMIGFISRLVWQKGVELIEEELMDLDMQLVVLGTGEKKYEEMIKELQQRYPDKVSARILFNGKLARRIYAGADIYLLPSRFEPCGLGQMMAMRYGTVPVVRDTGGLSDTVDREVGFKFKEFDARSLRKALDEALEVYYDRPQHWKRLQIAGMRRDFSWKRSASEYKRVYQELLTSKKDP